MELKNKTVLIISQQEWGTMFISKHHYATELAKRGNTVYYISGPDQENRMPSGAVTVEATENPSIFYIKHRLNFPYVLKFKARGLYDYLLRFHIRKILKAIQKPVDLVWSFDLSNTIPVKLFSAASHKIYMPVDELPLQTAIQGAKGADVIISVTQEILDKFTSTGKKTVFLNHGVADYFINDKIDTTINTPVQVGLSGNFLRVDIDREALLNIINDNKNIIFNFWGSTDYAQSNIVSSKNEEAISFIANLKACSNVVLHGQVPAMQLAKELKKMDCFLIAYDIDKDHSKGTNYHKILEYLATGKVVVSNNITTYQKYPGLIEMPQERHNANLPALFKYVINNLATYNAHNKQEQRIAFASERTYASQLDRIESYLN